MSLEKLCDRAVEAIQEADEEEVMAILEDAEKEGITTVALLKDGFSRGMEELGEKFAEGEVFLPELILASQAMKIVTDKVEKELEASGEESQKLGTVVMGTVQDDVHDIGKSICVAMLKSVGFEVIDLGKQVEPKEFIKAAKENNADIIGSSALLTTTMQHQKEIEDLLEEAGLKGKVKTMVGGAPVSQSWADQIGANGYSDDAMSCCAKAEELMKED